MKRIGLTRTLIPTLLVLAFIESMLASSAYANFMPLNIPAHNIEITADGEVTGADTIRRADAYYEFTSNIIGSIVIFCDDITINGNGYSLNGNGYSTGFFLEGRRNVTIKNVTISNFEHGIIYSYYREMYIASPDYSADSDCKNNALIANSIIDNKWGVYCYFAQNITFSENVISNNSEIGISIFDSGQIQVYRNTLSENNVAARFTNCDNSNVYGNNFINNANQTSVDPESKSGGVFGWSTINWNKGRLGNFWSDYEGTDLDKDGIGDAPYRIDNNNTDHYPLMAHITAPLPEKPQPEPLPTTLIITASVAALIVAAGLLVYFKKRKSEAEL